VEAITPGSGSTTQLLASQGRSAVSSDRAAITGRTLQVAALSNVDNAQRLAERLGAQLQEPAKVVATDRGGQRLYRVQLAPLTGKHTLNWLLQQLSQAGYPGAHLVDLP